VKIVAGGKRQIVVSGLAGIWSVVVESANDPNKELALFVQDKLLPSDMIDKTSDCGCLP